MRILHISSARNLGGGERHLIDLARGLAARGHEIHLALVPGSPMCAELSALHAQNIHTLPLRHALDIASIARLARLIREQKIEIIHAHVGRDYPLAAFAARLAHDDARLVITRHVMFPLSRIHRLTLSNVARVIAVSQASARALRERKIFRDDKIRIVSNAIDVESFERVARDADPASLRRELGVRAGAFVVGIVGELSELKGQQDFVRAAALVSRQRNDDVEFVIIGEDASRDGRQRAALEKLIADLEMERRVHLLGRREDVARILPALDALVSASRSEAFGLAIIEAMASGVPVVSTQTEGAREIIHDGVNGLLVPIGETDALASALNDLLNDEGRRDSFRTHALRMVRERFSIARMIAGTEEVYEEVRRER